MRSVPRGLLALLLAAGCGDPSGAADSDGGALPDQARIRHDFARDAPPAVSVEGITLDESGAVLPKTWVSVCNPLGCRSGDSNESGYFLLEGVELVDFGLRSHDNTTLDPYLGSVVRLFHPTVADVRFDAGKLYVPSFHAGPLLDPAAGEPRKLPAGDGLSLTFIGKDLEFPIGDHSNRIAARRIPAEHVPPYELGGEQLVTAYAFLPYATTSKSPMGVEVPAPVALAPDTPVHFRAVYEFEGRLGAPVAGHASGDGQTLSTDPGAGIDNLTWVLVTR